MPNTSDTTARVVYHLVHRNADDQWHLATEWDATEDEVYPTKETGRQAGERIGRAHVGRGERAQLIVHREDGSIETEYTYGGDPRGVPG